MPTLFADPKGFRWNSQASGQASPRLGRRDPVETRTLDPPD
jgi:hypothetical protein